MAENSIIRTITRLSLGFVLILVWGFMWLRADVLFPVNTDAWRTGYILTYLIFITLVFSFDTLQGSRTERSLFQVSFIKEFPKFIIGAVVSIAILFGFSFLFQGRQALNGVSVAIATVGIGVIILYAIIGAIGEELVFRGWVPEQLTSRGIRGNIVILFQAIVFALFHAGLSKSLFTMVLYVPLGIIFFFVKQKFSPRSNMANAGVHFGWNMFILGFLT